MKIHYVTISFYLIFAHICHLPNNGVFDRMCYYWL